MNGKAEPPGGRIRGPVGPGVARWGPGLPTGSGGAQQHPGAPVRPACGSAGHRSARGNQCRIALRREGRG